MVWVAEFSKYGPCTFLRMCAVFLKDKNSIYFINCRQNIYVNQAVNRYFFQIREGQGSERREMGFAFHMQCPSKIRILHANPWSLLVQQLSRDILPPTLVIFTPGRASCPGRFILPPANTSKNIYMLFCYFSVSF